MTETMTPADHYDISALPEVKLGNSSLMTKMATSFGCIPSIANEETSERLNNRLRCSEFFQVGICFKKIFFHQIIVP